MKIRALNRKSVRYCLIGVVVIAFTSFGIADAHRIRNQLNTWKLLPSPKHLTELYFANPNSLPSTYSVSVNQQFAFTVHNLEYHSVNYNYQIYEESIDGLQVTILKQGSFLLGQNQYKTISENIMLNDLGPQAKVVVNLINTSESIDYLIDRTSL